MGEKVEGVGEDQKNGGGSTGKNWRGETDGGGSDGKGGSDGTATVDGGVSRERGDEKEGG